LTFFTFSHTLFGYIVVLFVPIDVTCAVKYGVLRLISILVNYYSYDIILKELCSLGLH